MNENKQPTFPIDSVHVYAVGLIHVSACVPKNMPPEEIEFAVNVLHPTGVESKWRLSKDKTFATPMPDGTYQPNPCSCDQEAGRLHYLLSC